MILKVPKKWKFFFLSPKFDQSLTLTNEFHENRERFGGFNEEKKIKRPFFSMLSQKGFV